MNDDFASVRAALSGLPEVSRTWIEWSIDSAGQQRKTFVVEVGFDTDPSSREFNPAAMEKIMEAVTWTLQPTTIGLSSIRIVPDGLVGALAEGYGSGEIEAHLKGPDLRRSLRDAREAARPADVS